jgi:hypothetical protein
MVPMMSATDCRPEKAPDPIDYTPEPRRFAHSVLWKFSEKLLQCFLRFVLLNIQGSAGSL